jgi:hypothetical protein
MKPPIPADVAAYLKRRNDNVLALYLDLASYRAGRQPTPAQLHSAPLLNAWKTAVRLRGELGAVLTVVGEVTGHPSVADGGLIGSYPVRWLDLRRRWVRATESLYRLGIRCDEQPDIPEMEPDYGD